MNKDLNYKIAALYNSVKAKRLSRKELYHGHFIDLIEENYLLPNNKILKRERIIKNNHKEAVIVIAITNDNNFLLVAQNRVDNIVSLEFPSGYIEEGETCTEAATRELLEETGYVPESTITLDTYYSQLGIDSAITNIVIAYNCNKQYNQNLSPNEYLNYSEFTFEELNELIENNIINSVGNKLAFYKYLYYNLYNQTKVSKVKTIKKYKSE